MNIKSLKPLIVAAVLGGFLAANASARAGDSAACCNSKSDKPYTLKTCVVSGEKLGGDMGEPYVFVDQGQEIKLCCKSCLKDFKKDPAKYLKKIAEAKPSEKAAAPGHAHQ